MLKLPYNASASAKTNIPILHFTTSLPQSWWGWVLLLFPANAPALATAMRYQICDSHVKTAIQCKCQCQN